MADANVEPQNATSARMSSRASARTSTRRSPSHELDAPPWLRVESTLMSTAAAIREAYDQRLAPLGLTLSLGSLLAYIDEFGPVSQTRAAEHLDQGRASTGAQVDRLQGLGLVERQPDPADRRVWLVAITPAGRDLASAIAEVDEVLRRELRAGISRADRQLLTGLLVRLQHNLVAATRGDATDPPATTAAHQQGAST